MEKETSNPYTFFILRYRLVNLQAGILASEKEKNYGRRKYEYNSYNKKTKSTRNHRQAGGRIKGTFWECVSQFCVDQTFLNIVEADKKYAKNIQTGDVVIKRPNRQAYTDRDVELKDVKFVGGNVVRYQREQTKLRWKKLKDVLTEDDIMGNKSVEYFQQKWEELIKKYENLC